MARIIWTEPALIELEQVISYVEQFNPTAADSLASRLIAAGDSLGVFPNRGRLTPEGYRELVSIRPYILRYMVQDEQVFILRVRHAARLPDDA